MKYTFDYISDPGHGWIKVSPTIIRRFNLQDKISYCSYISAKTGQCYLEEDADGPLLIETIKSQGHTVKLKEFHRNGQSRIRFMLPYDKNLLR